MGTTVEGSTIVKQLRIYRGPTPFEDMIFFTNFGHIYHFFFFGEKVSSGI